MPHASSPIYLSTLLLEKNRWNGKGPSLNVAEWLEPTAESGFNGFELWMHHLALASRSDWEAIKAAATAHQIELPMLYAQLPTDTGDKGRRKREALLDACDFFRPKGLRFNLGEPLTPDGYLAKLPARIEIAKEMVRDIGRDTSLVFECQLYPFRPEEAAQVLAGIDASRVSLSLRPFEMTSADLDIAFGQKGSPIKPGAISHFGIRAKQGKDYIALMDQPDLCKKVLTQTRKYDFIGPWILETTDGVGAKGEDVLDLFDSGEKDLNFLQGLFAA
jgi:hypothetical protein